MRAPEWALNLQRDPSNPDLDKLSDTWSFGAFLYWCNKGINEAPIKNEVIEEF